MSYNTWHEYGLGFCVDQIETTPEKLLRLASLKQEVLKDVRDYLQERFDGLYNDNELTMSDFDELEGNCNERGVSYVLFNVIDDFEVTYAYDFEGTSYILYSPTYPWRMNDKDENLSEQKVIDIFTKYIRILTEDEIEIAYQSVENGG